LCTKAIAYAGILRQKLCGMGDPGAWQRFVCHKLPRLFSEPRQVLVWSTGGV
jgi:hypothetical protein